MNAQNVSTQFSHQLAMPVSINGRRFHKVIACLIAVTVFLAYGTWATGTYIETYALPWSDWSRFHRVMIQADLGRENNIAVWFSSMLLLSIAMMCLLCFVAEPKGRDKFRFRFGWVISATIFVLLSLDELGSIHEKLAIWNPASNWTVLLVPFIIMIPGYMLFFGLVQFRRSSAGFWFLLLGVALFSAVPVFEFFETSAIDVNGAVLRDTQLIWRTLEEFCEILGMFAFLTATFHFASAIGRLDQANQATEHPTVVFQTTSGRYLVMAALLTLVCFGGVLLSRIYLPPFDLDGADGIAENWFASALLMVTALLLAQWRPRAKSSLAQGALVVAIAFLSAYLGGNLQIFFYKSELSWLRIAILAALALPFVLALVTRAGKVTCLAALVPLAVVLFGPSPDSSLVGVLAAGILLGYVGYVMSLTVREPSAP